MKLLILILFILNSAASFCQFDRDEVIASSGGSSDENGIMASWTMGETIINEFSIPGYSLSQGFQKGHISIASESGDLPDEIIITAYPNPVLSSLSIKIVNSFDSYHWSVNVYDSKGEVIIKHETEEDITEVNFTSLPPGAYLVKIHHQDNYKIFNIIKQ
jgi:hypothetical protein